MTRRRWAALAGLVAVVLAFLGVRELREHPAIDLASSLEELDGVQSAQVLEWPELRDDEEVTYPLLAEVGASTNQSDLTAILQRTAELTVDRGPRDERGGHSISEVTVHIGTARIRLYEQLDRPKAAELARSLRALSDLPEGTAVISADGTWIDPGSADPLGVAAQGVERLQRVDVGDLNVWVGQMWEEHLSTVWVTGDSAALRLALTSLQPMSSRVVKAQLNAAKSGDDSRVSLTTRTEESAQLSSDLRRAQQAARVLRRTPEMTLSSGGLSISGTGDPAFALQAVETMKASGLTVTSISTDRKQVELQGDSPNVGGPAALARAVRALRPALPDRAELKFEGSDGGERRFEGTAQQLAVVAPSAARLEREGYTVFWSAEPQRDEPRVEVRLRSSDEWTPAAIAAAMRRLRTVPWTGIAQLTISAPDQSEEFWFRSTSDGPAEVENTSEYADDVGGISRSLMERLWNKTAGGAGP